MKFSNIIALFALSTALSLSGSVCAVEEIDDAIEFLTKPGYEFDQDNVVELLSFLDKEYEANRRSNRYIAQKIEQQVGIPKKLINYGQKSIENCDKFNYMTDFEATIEIHHFALKEYLKGAFWEQDRLCSDTFAQRFKEKLADLDADVKSEANALARHFQVGDPPYDDPYEFTSEHLFGGSVKVVERYLDSKTTNGRSRLISARDKLFSTCQKIIYQFHGFLWTLMKTNFKNELSLSHNEKEFLSVIKVCSYMPYENLDSDAGTLIALLKTPQLTESWGRGGISSAISLLRGFVEQLREFPSISSVDLYAGMRQIPEKEVDSAILKYLKETLKVPQVRTGRPSKEVENRAKEKHFSATIQGLEHHCQKMMDNFDPYLYLIERLQVKSANSDMEPAPKEAFVLTKVCQSIVRTPERTFSNQQMDKLRDAWMSGREIGESSGGSSKNKLKKVLKFLS